MTARNRTVQATFRGQTITAALYWTSGDPLAISIVFANDEAWVVSRDVITKAMTGGFVAPQETIASEITVIRSSLDTFTVTRFHKVKHPVAVTLPYADLRSFITETYNVIPPGMEYSVIDWKTEFPELAS